MVEEYCAMRNRILQCVVLIYAAAFVGLSGRSLADNGNIL